MAANKSPVGSVKITGTARQGQTLIASNTLADADGLGTIAYQWLADGVAIKGATASSFKLTQAQVGKAISVRAGYTDGQGTVESRSSTSTTAVANVNDAGSVKISGTVKQGQTLTATVSDADGVPTTGIAYQWLADGVAIDGATASTFKLSQAQVGKAISVRAGYTDGYGTVESRSSTATSAVVNVNDAPTGSVTISGSAKQGQTLKAANTLADADGLGTIGYQWLADGQAIDGATASSFKLTQAQVGKAISVRAGYTDAYGAIEGKTSTVTAKVVNVNDAPTGSVTIAGSAKQGQTLKAANTLADADGLGTIGYQWLADGQAIDGATASTFKLTQAQVGKSISVRAGYTDAYGAIEGKTSTVTAKVVNVNDAPTGSVTIAGSAKQGETLSASNTLADADGLGTVGYQWLADGVAIDGATASSFKLTQAQVGQAISVRAGYTDGQGAAEAVTSAATGAVIRSSEPRAGIVTISAEPGAAAAPAFDVASDLVLTFSEAITKGSGAIALYKTDGTLIESFDAATSSRLTFSGRQLIIDPTWTLEGSADLHLKIAAGAVGYEAGGVHAGVSDQSLAFRTGVETGHAVGAAPVRDQFPGTASESIGAHSALFIRATFSDLNRAPTTLEEARASMDDVAAFYQDNSRGRMTLATTYTPVVTLDFSHQWQAAYDADVDGLSVIQQAARQKALELGYDPSQYDVVVVRVDASLRGGASYGGGSSVWLGWGGSSVAAHEIGHALGLGHSNSLTWSNGRNEYGNGLDNMGDGGTGVDHFMNAKKLALGWIDASDLIRNPGPGLYRIHAQEQTNSVVGNYHGLEQLITKDALGTNASYAFEYRPAQGGAYENALVIYRNDLDMKLVQAGSEDLGITLGRTYRLPGSDAYFTVTGKGDGYLDLAYQQGPFPDNVAPSVALSASATTVKANEAVTFTAEAIDANGDGLVHRWSFSDGVLGIGSTFTRHFSQTTQTAVDVTLEVSDMHGGLTTKTMTVTAGAASTASPVTLGSLLSPSYDKPRIAVVASDAFSAEGGDSGRFTISRIGTPTGAALVVKLGYSGTGLGDFASLPASVTIAAGESSASLSLTPADDAAKEGVKRLSVAIAADPAYDISSQNGSAAIQVGDDDAPVVTLQAIDPMASESGRDAGIFLVSRSGPTDRELTVYYGLSGTAYNGTDYGRLDGQVVIAAGQSSATVSIVALDDDSGEAAETVTLALASFDDAYSVGAASEATVTIADNGDRPTVSVTGTRDRSIQSEGQALQLVFTANGGTGAPLEVHYTVSGSASSGSDFTPLSGKIMLATGGSQTTTLSIPTVADGIAENDESIVIKIDPSPAYSLGLDSSAQLTLLQPVDEAAGGDRVHVSSFHAAPTEASGPLQFYVYRDSSHAARQALSVGYALEGTATPGVDYSGEVRSKSGALLSTFTPAASNRVTIPADADGVVISLLPVDDALAEGAETVRLKLLSVSGGNPIGINSSASYVMADNDASATRVGFGAISALIAEEDRAADRLHAVEVVLSQPAPAGGVQVGYRPGAGSALGRGVDWSFVDENGNDLPATTGVLSFSAGQTSQTLRYRVQNDHLIEGAETFSLLLENPVGASIRTGFDRHSVTLYDVVPDGLIKEERWAGSAVFSSNSWDSSPVSHVGYLSGLTTAQNVGNDFSRRLSGEITAPSTGQYTFYASGDDAVRLYLGSSAAAGKQLIASVPAGGWTGFQQWDKYASQRSATLTLQAGQKYAIEVQHQDGGGADHLSIGWTGPDFSSITPISTAASVPSDDNRYLRFVTHSATAIEGQPLKQPVLVALDRANDSAAISVDVELVGNSSTAGSADYSLARATLSFAPGEVTQALDLSILPDAIDEAVERLVLRLVNAEGAQIIGPAASTVVITDANAPQMVGLQGVVGDGMTADAILGQVTATPAAGRSIASWEIVAGNAVAEGQSTPAFAIDAQGRLYLANPAALPLGAYQLQLVVRATDNLGASNLVAAQVAVHGSSVASLAAADQLPGLVDKAGIASYALAGTALTDTGTAASIRAGEFTRDTTLGLSGRADAGATVGVYDGTTRIASTQAAANGTWSLTTPTLAPGQHLLRAEVIDGAGNVAVTQAQTFTVRPQLEINPLQLVSAAPGGGATATGSFAVGNILNLRPVDQGVISYELLADTPFTEQRWNSTTPFDTNQWTTTPDYSGTLTSLTTARNVGDNYSRLVTGWVQAPQTGTYRFSIAGDDDAKLFISSDDKAAHKGANPIASVPAGSWTDFQQWSKYASQTSAGITLQAGQRYYIEVQHREAGGGDHVSVGWTGPGIGAITPVSIPAHLMVADLGAASVELASHGSASDSRPAGVPLSYGGTSPDGRYLVYGASQVGAFGNGGSAFSDANPLSGSPYSDLFAFDQDSHALRLLTAGASATSTASRQAQFVGISADSRFAVYTSDYVENIAGFSAPGKAQPDAWTLVDGGYPGSAGKLKATTLKVADIDPNKLSFQLSGGYISNDGQAATVSAVTIKRPEPGKLTFWVQGSLEAKAVKLELQDTDAGILVKATAAKYGAALGSDWDSVGTSGVVATSLGAAGYGVSLLQATGSNLSDAMRAEAMAPSRDVVAYDLNTGQQMLLSHSAAAGHLQSDAANVGNVTLAADGRHVLFSAADATRLGNGGVAFGDSATGVNDLFAADLHSGQIRLLTHGRADANASAGVAATLQGSTANGHAILSAADVTAFGFSDGAASAADLFAADLSDGTLRLISRASAAAPSSSAGQAVTFEQAVGRHVYFSARDATAFGFASDADTSRADLFRYDTASGAIELLSHAATSTVAALGGHYVGGLTVSPDGRHVAFALDMRSSGGGFNIGVGGTALFVADTQTGAIRIVNSGNAEGNSLSYAAWAAIENRPRYFTPDSKTLVWQTHYSGWQASDVTSKAAGYHSSWTVEAYALDLGDGVSNAGSAQLNRLLSHGAAGTTQAAAESVNLVGVSADSRLAFFTAADATRFGNDGIAFTDSAPSATDLFAVDLKTRAVDLLSGVDGVSFGQGVTFQGIADGGAVTMGVGDVAGIVSAAGPLTDPNGSGIDLLAVRMNLIDLATASDTSGANAGTAYDNVTASRELDLSAWLRPDQSAQLYDGEKMVGAATADASGHAHWHLSEVSSGSHYYSLHDATEQIPIQLAGALAASSLEVIVL